MDEHTLFCNPRDLGQVQVGKCLTSALKEAAIAQNGTVSFVAIVIFTFNATAIQCPAFVAFDKQHKSQSKFFKPKSTSKQTNKLSALFGKQKIQNLTKLCTSLQLPKQTTGLTISLPSIDEEHLVLTEENYTQSSPTKFPEEIAPAPVYQNKKYSKRRQ